VVLPRRNEADLDDVPEEARRKLEFRFADKVEDVFEAAFSTERRPRRVGAHGRAPLHGEDVRPHGEDVRPHGEDVRPQGEDARPQGEDVRPQGEGAPPQGEGVRPEGT
jgi:hypothetical protein